MYTHVYPYLTIYSNQYTSPQPSPLNEQPRKDKTNTSTPQKYFIQQKIRRPRNLKQNHFGTKICLNNFLVIIFKNIPYQAKCQSFQSQLLKSDNYHPTLISFYYVSKIFKQIFRIKKFNVYLKVMNL